MTAVSDELEVHGRPSEAMTRSEARAACLLRSARTGSVPAARMAPVSTLDAADIKAFIGSLVLDPHLRDDLFQEVALVLWHPSRSASSHSTAGLQARPRWLPRTSTFSRRERTSYRHDDQCTMPSARV